MKNSGRRTARRWGAGVGMTIGGVLATALVTLANAPAASAVLDDGQNVTLANDNPFAVLIGSPAGDTVNGTPVPLDLADQAIPHALAAQFMADAYNAANSFYGTDLPDLNAIGSGETVFPFASLIGAPPGWNDWADAMSPPAEAAQLNAQFAPLYQPLYALYTFYSVPSEAINLATLTMTDVAGTLTFTLSLPEQAVTVLEDFLLAL